jgi:hypothetical protein
MAKITFNTLVNSIRGKVDNAVIRLTPSGTLALCKMPDMSNVEWSDAQRAHRQRFKEAIALAKEAIADPKVRAKYERAAKKQGKRAFDVAVSDFYNRKNSLEA